MSARFLVLYGMPRDVDGFDRHYRQTRLPPARALPGLRQYTLGREIRMVRGDGPYHLVA